MTHPRTGLRLPTPLAGAKRQTRPRPAQGIPVPLEWQEQKTIVQMLQLVLQPQDCEWTHHPSGAHGTGRDGRRLKAMGNKPGWPDLEFVRPGGLIHFIEVKRMRSGKLSDAQIACHARLRALGCQVAVLHTAGDVYGQLKLWNFPVRAAVIGPGGGVVLQ